MEWQSGEYNKEIDQMREGYNQTLIALQTTKSEIQNNAAKTNETALDTLSDIEKLCNYHAKVFSLKNTEFTQYKGAIEYGYHTMSERVIKAAQDLPNLIKRDRTMLAEHQSALNDAKKLYNNIFKKAEKLLSGTDLNQKAIQKELKETQEIKRQIIKQFLLKISSPNSEISKLILEKLWEAIKEFCNKFVDNLKDFAKSVEAAVDVILKECEKLGNKIMKNKNQLLNTETQKKDFTNAVENQKDDHQNTYLSPK